SRLKTPMVPGPYTSCVINMSALTQMFSPAWTLDLPAARARIFSVSVIFQSVNEIGGYLTVQATSTEFIELEGKKGEGPGKIGKAEEGGWPHLVIRKCKNAKLNHYEQNNDIASRVVTVLSGVRSSLCNRIDKCWRRCGSVCGLTGGCDFFRAVPDLV